MKRSSPSLLVTLALLAGCPGGSSSPIPAPGSADGGWLSYADGNPGQPDSAPAWSSDTAVAPADSAAVATADAAPASASCPFGNLLSAIPALPPLCRPFPATPPSPPPLDPPSCQAAPQVQLTTGADTFVGGDSTKDVVMGYDGADFIQGLGCSDELNGNQGADEIHGNQGNDQIHAGAGDDTVRAGAGHDSIWGGGGSDTIYGGSGDDTFYYAEGEGHDVINESNGHDTIVCAPNFGKPKARITGWSRVGDDLLLTMAASGSVAVKSYFASAASSIDAIVGCD